MNKLENAIVIFGLENGQYSLSDVIEICGYWVWLSGNTYPHKETIRNLA